MSPPPLLRLRDVTIRYGTTTVIDGLELDVEKGEAVALTAPSGAGKTSLALALIGLLPKSGKAEGSAVIGDIDLFSLSEEQWSKQIRGRRIGMVTQDPAGWLDPVQHVDDQVAEAIRVCTATRQRRATELAREMLERVGLPSSSLRAFPHELSGGMRQRVAIAMALAGRPDLIIADEPTSALDSTMQKQILDLLNELCHDGRTSVLLFSHDPDVIGYASDRVVSLSGEPSLEKRSAKRRSHLPGNDVVLEAKGLTRRYASHVAVDGVDVTVKRGETVALIGESGSGKTTLARILSGLERHDGVVMFEGRDIGRLSRRSLRELRRSLQYVAQNQYGSLDPRMTVGQSVREPLVVHRSPLEGRADLVRDVLSSVGVEPSMESARPAELSGGQRQRVALARALVSRPSFLVLDEPLTGLDASLRYDVLTLLADLRERFGFTCLLVSHDLDAVRSLADRILVMSEGRVVEELDGSDLSAEATHPATRALLEASLSQRSENAR